MGKQLIPLQIADQMAGIKLDIEDQLLNLQRLLKATQIARCRTSTSEDKQTAMAVIKQLTGRTNLPDRTNSLTQYAVELMLAGNSKREIVIILIARENLSPEEVKVLEGILLTME
ncbi:MAG: hypothetical protein C0433_14445 [Cyclobacterium sp.]|nr:hypothetical protein [Cyclobacterium sp.]